MTSGVRKESDVFAVTIESSHKFAPTNISDASGCGKFSSDYIDIVQALLDEPSLRLQASCTVGSPQLQKATAKPVRLGPCSHPCELSIIVYGPKELLDNVGEFFQDLEIYLQDPEDCEWDVKYCNPHRLSSLNINDCPMTSSLCGSGAGLDQTLFQMIPGELDVLGVLDVSQELPEADQPPLILPFLKK